MSARVLVSTAVVFLCALSHPAFSQDVTGLADPSSSDLAAAQQRLEKVAGDFEVSEVAIEQIEFPMEAGLPFATDVRIGGGDYVLDLEPHSLRSASFRLLVSDENGVHEEIPEEPRTYRGIVLRPDGSEIAGSVVAGSLIDGKFEGVVDLADGALWFIQPVSRVEIGAGEKDYVIYRGEDTLPGEGRCGVPDDAVGVILPEGAAGIVQGTRGVLATGDKVADVAFDADTQFYNLNGSSVANTMFDIENVMNTIEFIYERDVDITYEITVIFVRTCCTTDPYTTNVCGSLLDQMVSEWTSDPDLQGIQRDTAHLMTGRNLTDPCLGVAFLGTICGSNSYGLSQSKWSANFNNRVVVTAHELGHNWNAAHCDASGNACDIMCSGVGGCGGYGLPDFGAVEQGQIEAFKNTRTCLFPTGGVGVTLADAISLPFVETFPSTSFDDAKWIYRDSVSIGAAAVGEPSAPNSVNMDSVGTGDDDQNDLRSNFMLLLGEQAVAVEYYTQHIGAEAGDSLIVEYWSKNGTNLSWAALNTVVSDGVDQNSFTTHSHQLTIATHPTAFHDEFRLRFRTDGNDSGDDWNVDDIRVYETGTLTQPLVDTFPLTAINTSNWTGIDSATTSTRGIGEPSPDRSLNLNGTLFGGDQVRSAEIDTSAIVDLVVTYSYERTGEEESPETGDDLIVEYLNASEQWIEVNRHFGSGADMVAYEFVSLVLPAGAHHSGMRLRFRVATYEDQNDDWFVDDVCIGDVGDCNFGPQPCKGVAECDDGIACTSDACTVGFCEHTTNSGMCDDGLACTNNACSALEGCVFSPVDANCSDGVACTDDTCNPASGCVFTANDDNCDDAVPCTLDACSEVSGCSFVAEDTQCDDGLNCTDDSCDQTLGCEFVPNGSLCGDVQGAVVTEETDAVAEANGLRVCHVHVLFDSADDNLLSIGFSNITTNDPNGFYQHAFTDDTPPNSALCAIFPEVCLDSFVTIGCNDDACDQGTTSTDGDWNSPLFNTGGATAGGWFNSTPDNGHGAPDATLLVLAAQLTVREGFSITGNMIAYSNDGIDEASVSFECFTSCIADFNNDGVVDAADLAILLGAWGVNPGHEADLNDDGVVNASDLASLLGAWGPC